MYKRYFSVVLIITCAFANLFFSEYAEGSSNNKYLEIYNGSQESIDLGNYSLSSCSNGCDDGINWDYPDNITFDSNTILLPNDVFVVCHGSSDVIISAECDETFTYLSNGDDVFGLTTISGEIIDIIGEIGEDPGDGWDIAGVTNATKDHTLVRSPAVNSGNGGDWGMSAGTNASDSEWIVYDQNTWDYIGFHLCSACGSGGDNPLLFIQSPSDGETLNSTDYTILFTVYNFEVGTDGYIVYNLDGNENNINDTDPILVTGALEGEHYLSMELVDTDGNSLDPAIEADISFSISLPSLTNISDIQNDIDTFNGQTVIVQGVVTIGDDLLFPGRTKFYIQDESGRGIQVYNSDELAETYNRGDFIEVMGIVELYNDDVELTNPTITLIDTDNDLPEPYEIQGIETVSMNGTWAIVTGVLSDYWHYTSGSTEFTALTITSNNGTETQTMFWNSAVPASELTQFEEMIGEELAISGVVSFYNSAVQLTCGYLIDIQSNVDPNLPIADAGNDQIVSPGEIVYLDASASFDSGSIVAYEWVQLDGPAVNLEDEENPITSFTAPAENSIITFRLTIWDDDINEDTDQLTIVVQEPGSSMTIYDIIHNCGTGVEILTCDGQYDLSSSSASGCPLYETNVTTTGTIIDYFDITPFNGPHSFTIEDDDGNLIDFVVWPESSEYQDGFDITQTELNILTQPPFGIYSVQITGELGAYCDDDELLDINSEWQITIEYETNIQISTEEVSEDILPKYNSLSQNFPNPFNPETMIEFNIKDRDRVNISIFDLKGNLVLNLIDNIYVPGHYSIIWNGENINGKELPSGLYFYQLKTSTDILTKRMLLVR